MLEPEEECLSGCVVEMNEHFELDLSFHHVCYYTLECFVVTAIEDWYSLTLMAQKVSKVWMLPLQKAIY